jgi:FkbM family methyltransferase
MNKKINFLKGRLIRSINRTLSHFNINITPAYPKKMSKYRKWVLSKIGTDLTLDVGANRGQYALELIKEGFKGKIISFEPLSDVYEKLLLQSREFDNWEVYERCAVGNINGEIEINVSENLVSSSIYSVLEKSIVSAPTSAVFKKEKVKISRLDDVLKFDKRNKIHLKIDVQGYEKEVLEGAKQILESVLSLELEISLIPLYKGAISPEELLIEIKKYGFSPVSYISGFIDRKNGGILQLDGLFIKNDLLSFIG